MNNPNPLPQNPTAPSYNPSNSPSPSTISLPDVELAIVRNGGQSLGNCYYQHNFIVYTKGNPDNTQYDSISTHASAAIWRAELLATLPPSNAGANLGPFSKVPGTPNIYQANAWIRIDSGD